MKAQMFNWGHLSNLPSWFKDGEEIDITTQHIEEILSLNYQVLIKDWNKSGKIMFCVDNASFRQH